jgi:hypothetical protein
MLKNGSYCCDDGRASERRRREDSGLPMTNNEAQCSAPSPIDLQFQVVRARRDREVQSVAIADLANNFTINENLVGTESVAPVSLLTLDADSCVPSHSISLRRPLRCPVDCPRRVIAASRPQSGTSLGITVRCVTDPEPATGLLMRMRVGPVGYALIRPFGRPFVTIDGVEHEAAWGEVFFPTTPGNHNIGVGFYFWRSAVPYGEASVTLSIASGTTETVRYFTPIMFFENKGRIKVLTNETSG